MAVKTIEWKDGAVVMIDQRLLPGKEEFLVCRSPEEVAEAIRTMAIRGAPAIGIAAGYGLALAVMRGPEEPNGASGHFAKACALLAATRPTAVNLFRTIDIMKTLFEEKLPEGIFGLRRALLEQAHRIHQDDVAACRRMGAYGQELVPDGATILTHCNAGALATGGYGTALGVVRAAVEAGKTIRVLAGETRPWLQGARLTTYELAADGIPVTLICDNMAGYFMQAGEIDLVVVGADRVAANGDTANKIGTYSIAILAGEHGIPFYVAAPLSTIDRSLPDGKRIKIEERSPEEVLCIGGSLAIAPPGVAARNPAFDLTPARYISALITERGLAKPPSPDTIAALFDEED